MFAVAHAALTNHPQLQKVVIMQHAPRYDRPDVDPIKLKPELAKLANSTLNQMWHSSAMRDRIMVGVHSLDCPDDLLDVRYRDEQSGRYDGVHMYGRFGMRAYTRSLLQIIQSALPKMTNSPTTPLTDDHPSDDHSTCPQTKYMNKQKKVTKPRYESNRNIYRVPVSNQFDILGN